jgi:benzoyl-CoA reductase/2-hydroxyglutaryl-CoA dehydratase subunit BcrC/BadD/HgdB
MELSSRDLEIADSLGIDESFCPVRAMLGAFLTEAHFPIPDLLTCNVGATCDDFSAIAQRLNGLGFPILWWETPHRRQPDSAAGEESVPLPGGLIAPREQVDFVRSELERVRGAIEEVAGGRLDDAALRDGIRVANRMRRVLAELRELSYSAPVCPIPALEMLVAEMLAIHFCSDREEAIRVLEELLEEARRRVGEGVGPLRKDAVRVFWVNPVADLRAMNILEDCGGRVCGTEYLFSHALDPIPEDVPPMEALARTALADPMVGPCSDRADRICRDIQLFGAEAVLVSRIPGASHCAVEGAVIHEMVRERLGLPVQEIEVPPLCDAVAPTIRTRIEALIETVKARRKP